MQRTDLLSVCSPVSQDARWALQCPGFNKWGERLSLASWDLGMWFLSVWGHSRNLEKYPNTELCEISCPWSPSYLGGWARKITWVQAFEDRLRKKKILKPVKGQLIADSGNVRGKKNRPRNCQARPWLLLFPLLSRRPSWSLECSVIHLVACLFLSLKLKVMW